MNCGGIKHGPQEKRYRRNGENSERAKREEAPPLRGEIQSPKVRNPERAAGRKRWPSYSKRIIGGNSAHPPKILIPKPWKIRRL